MKCWPAAAALMLGLSANAGATPPNMSIGVYMARLKQIEASYAADRAACRASATSRADRSEICLADAMGNDHVAKANLEVDYRSTPRTLLEASDARASAAFWVARERCADLVFTLQAACVQDAKAAAVAAKAEARLRSRSVTIGARAGVVK